MGVALSRGYQQHTIPPPAADDGQHECARGTWCASPRLIRQDDGSFARAPGLTWRAFCEACRGRIDATLEDLPAAYTRLAVELSQRSRAGDTVRAPFGPVLPLRDDVDALMRLMGVTLCGWEARVRAVARLTPRDPAQPVNSETAIKQAADTCGIHLDALLALEPGWMTRAVPLHPGRHGQETRIDDDTAAAYSDADVVRMGVDYLTILVRLGGADAGNEILGPGPETLDGVPCRACGDFALERAEPPSDPARPAMWARCASCQADMSPEDYTAWAKWYARWAETGGPPTCRRCSRDRHQECAWAACGCAAAGHPAA
jgi:hypothetical protein